MNVEAANGLDVIAPPPAIAIGSPVLVAVSSTNASPAFTYTVSNTSDPAVAGDLTATLMPQSNPVLQVVTNMGTMDFELFQNGSVSRPTR